MLALVGMTNKRRTVVSRVDVSLLQVASRLRDIRRREVPSGVGCKFKMLFVWTSDDNGSCTEGGAGRRGLTGDVVATVHVITNNPERDSL
jgi:hypothetical protein